MSLFQKLNQDLQAALKNRDQVRLSVLRMLKSRVLYVNARGELPDPEIIKIINKYAKDLKEAIEEFLKVKREGEAEKIKSELAIVQEYLPKALRPEELKELVKKCIQEVGATTVKDQGKVMKAVLAQAPGADGKQVNQIVRETLQ